MTTNLSYIMTLANGIIGVSVLAMPFCYKQCGIILSTFMLLLSSVISRLACHFLLKSAIMARRRTFEFLAFHAFGSTGKFVVELGIIGFLLGTCIAFFVVMGDLGPAIISNLLNLGPPTDTLRSTVLISVAVFCIMPLGLLKNVDSLTSVCTATVGFYFCLVTKIILEALPHILSGDWISKVELWRPAGILQCIPIFSMALFCQTQIFEIYANIPNPSLETMNSVVRGAVNICTAVYVFVGVFGYIAFQSQPFSGNVMMSFTPSFTTDAIKIGFVLSVAFSFPLVIFPCRASLHSLLFKRAQTPHDVISSYIPEARFKWLTIFIVAVSLVTGLLIPSIELVLGLVGSTIGVMICVLFPATCFICMTTKNTNERVLAQIMLVVGILVMTLGTYANLYAMEEANFAIIPTTAENKFKAAPLIKSDNTRLERHDIPVVLRDQNVPPVMLEEIKSKLERNKNNFNKSKSLVRPDMKMDISETLIKNDADNVPEIRHEPPQPIEPADPVPMFDSKMLPKIPPETKDEHLEAPAVVNTSNPKQDVQEVKDSALNNVPVKPRDDKELVDREAIKKEDIEIAEEAKVEHSTIQSAQELIDKLKEQGAEQVKVLQEAQQMLKEIWQQKEELKREKQRENLEKKKAAIEIQKIAKMAIESLAAQSRDNQILKEPTNVEPKRITTIPEVKPKENPALYPKLNPINITGNLDNVVSKLPGNIVHGTEHEENNEVLAENKQEPVHDLNVTLKKLLVPLPIVKSNQLNIIEKMKKETNIPVVAIEKLESKVDHDIGNEINKQNIKTSDMLKDKSPTLESRKAKVIELKPPKLEESIASKEKQVQTSTEKKSHVEINPGRDILSNVEITEKVEREKREVENVVENTQLNDSFPIVNSNCDAKHKHNITEQRNHVDLIVSSGVDLEPKVDLGIVQNQFSDFLLQTSNAKPNLNTGEKYDGL